MNLFIYFKIICIMTDSIKQVINLNATTKHKNLSFQSWTHDTILHVHLFYFTTIFLCPKIHCAEYSTHCWYRRWAISIFIPRSFGLLFGQFNGKRCSLVSTQWTIIRQFDFTSVHCSLFSSSSSTFYWCLIQGDDWYWIRTVCQEFIIL
jgi:hypothetical protein